jgi:signal transduction histidine kinase
VLFKLSQLQSIQWDFSAIAVLVFGVCVVAFIWLYVRLRLRSVMIGILLFACVFLVIAWNLIDRSGGEEKRRMREKMEAIAPTFAQEVQRMGHEKISFDTPKDDPVYLAIIQAEIRWQTITPSVFDIYTFRRLPDGGTCLIVDSETDYDRNGKFEGDREQRTAIGELFKGDETAIAEAFTGHAAFTEKPTTDRWGTWVSAYYPLFDSNGMQEAVLGVDFDAVIWTDTVGKARTATVAYLAVFWTLASTCTGTGALMLSRRNALLQAAAAATEESRRKLEGLINTIDAVVWEWAPISESYVFVSAQAEQLLGRPGSLWVTNKTFWRNQVWPDDVQKIMTQRRQAAEDRVPYQSEYRVFSSMGRVIWIRERGMKVEDADRGVLIRGIMTDVTSEKLEDSQLEALNKQLEETSRQAGMAQVASGVLHNVGNVLNSVVTSSSVASDILKRSKLPMLGRLSELLAENARDLPGFFAHDARGSDVPRLTAAIFDELQEEHRELVAEIENLNKNIGHIKEVVMMQQTYASSGGNIRPLDVSGIMDDSIRISESDLIQSNIRIVREYDLVPLALGDRNRVLQVLVNLVRNARSALDESATTEKIIKAGIHSDDKGLVRISVYDNGIGISEESLSQLFVYGFTTRSDGHGFGLYTGALAAREMGGRLYAESKGLSQGATFTLELPSAGNDKTTHTTRS